MKSCAMFWHETAQHLVCEQVLYYYHNYGQLSDSLRTPQTLSDTRWKINANKWFRR